MGLKLNASSAVLHSLDRLWKFTKYGLYQGMRMMSVKLAQLKEIRHRSRIHRFVQFFDLLSYLYALRAESYAEFRVGYM